jgi:hypothetical protein
MQVFVGVHICVAVGDPIIKRRGLVPYIGVCPISQRHNVEVVVVCPVVLFLCIVCSSYLRFLITP